VVVSGFSLSLARGVQWLVPVTLLRNRRLSIDGRVSVARVAGCSSLTHTSPRVISTFRFAFFNPCALIGFVPCLSGVLLASAGWSEAFAQAPSAPTHLPVSSVQFPEASAYANTILTYKIIDAPC